MQIMPGTFAEICFNPCSAGFRSETLGGLAESIFHSRVSILVLLDSALRLQNTWTGALALRGVSILVLLDSALRHHDDPAYAATVNVSILVLLDSALRLICLSTAAATLSRFNPCSAGFRSETVRGLRRSVESRKPIPRGISARRLFQSLFCWIPL